jgi:hypothetical protein
VPLSGAVARYVVVLCMAREPDHSLCAAAAPVSCDMPSSCAREMCETSLFAVRRCVCRTKMATLKAWVISNEDQGLIFLCWLHEHCRRHRICYLACTACSASCRACVLICAWLHEHCRQHRMHMLSVKFAALSAQPPVGHVCYSLCAWLLEHCHRHRLCCQLCNSQLSLL